ncbi:MAG TPA: trehalase family glycosidase [Chloroflexia bacterium]|nr:trehalase family glycosidase [Chloroflexia bacterium]
MFPLDNYTPHGYLDNPAHAWKAGPGGVLRSRPAIGMGWHYPSYAHAYNRTWYYRAFLQLGFGLANGRWLLDGQDFRQAGLELYSDYHSKNWLSFVFNAPDDLRVRVIFYLAEVQAGTGDALGCLVQVRNRGKSAQPVKFAAILDYERHLGANLDWTSGLFVRRNESGLTVGAFQEGMTLHLRSNSPVARDWLNAGSLEELRAQLEGARASQAETDEDIARKVAALQFEESCPPGEDRTFQLVVARDVSEWPAVQRASTLLKDEATLLYESLARGQQEDTAFWQRAPKLRGDWPEHVRRGMVYDIETLRMMVRPPAGIYKHRWDAMQLQVPRTVLAEAALDMLIMSYADPEAAKEVLLGTFADAPEPNVPCSREDGSYNMVALDGSPCGTAPEWCFPFHCIEIVYRRTLDKAWLAELYPHLEAFMEFWQSRRTDGQGRPFYKCSWEAGQDNSARFAIENDPSGGGALGEHLWPVDLQAAMAQSCWLLAAWAAELGLSKEQVERWNNLGGQHYAFMQQMWQPDKGWFHDFDRRSNAFTGVIDTMQLAPLLCRAVTPEQVASLQAKLENPPNHGQVFHPLMWPSVAFCLIEACAESGRSDLAAHHGWTALDAVYRWVDARPATIAADQGGLPGVAREYWPQVANPTANPPRGGGGAEVYGWGCLGAYILPRYVMGLQEERPKPGETVAFNLRPNLPAALLQSGKTYGIEALPCQGALVDLSYQVVDNTGTLNVVVKINWPDKPEEARQKVFALLNNQSMRVSF